MLKQDAAFAKQWWKSGHIRQFFLDGLVAPVANFDQAVRDPNDFVPFILSRHQRDQIQVAVRRE
ncbi:MAG: hypothetical protein IH787_03295 [Nitrospirae bacterium]|nr:hypothetical protein [Nitrospirota bacterium]